MKKHKEIHNKTIEKGSKILYNVSSKIPSPERRTIMKYRITVIIASIALVILAGTYFFTQETTVSELENRNMFTFNMIFNPVTNPESTVYNAEKGFSDRLEDAMKDQIAIREPVVLFYSGLEGKMGNIYNTIWMKLFFRPDEGVEEDEETEDVGPETAPPEDGYPDEYYDLPVETEVVRDPETLDFDKYPGYGYARLESFKKRNYTLTSAGQSLWYVNGTKWIGQAPTTGTTLDQNGQKTLAHSVAQLEAIMAAYPDMKVYNYFVTQIRDTPWFEAFQGGEFLDRFEIIAQALPEEIRVDKFVYDDLADYQATNYASDHHWSHLGSERGYRDVYAMMAEDLELTPMKYPIREWNFSELYGVEYRGSRANKLKDTYDGWDEFLVYEYDLGSRETFVLKPGDLSNEIPVELTLMSRYKTGNINKNKYYDHYIQFYGSAIDLSNPKTTYADSGHVFVIKNDNGAAHNILMVGDSTQRAYRDVIASHFGTAVYLDYRIMAQVPVDVLIDTYDIDVLMVGGLYGCYWLSSGCVFNFSANFGK